MSRVLTISGCVLALVCAISTAGVQDAGARAAVDAAARQFAAALTKGDAAAIAALYGTGAEAFPPNGNVVRGRAEIQKMWESVIASGIGGATLTPVEVESDGDLAYETGTFEMKTKDGKVADRGKYVVVWKRTGGKWMMHRDIWNTSQPPPAK